RVDLYCLRRIVNLLRICRVASRQKNKMMKNNLRLLSAVIAAWMLVVSAQACGSGGPKPINYGKDQCAHCRMTVSDARFGSQLVTKKGRAFHFDDVQCLVAYVEGGTVAGGEVAGYYLPDYAGEHRLLPA